MGDHIRKKRLDLGLLQREVALLLASIECSVHLWEKNKTSPTLPFLPRIIEFLSYCPIDPEDNAGRGFAWARKCNGLSQSEMAEAIGVDPGTMGRLERGEWRGREGYISRTIGFLDFKSTRVAGLKMKAW